MKSMSNSVAWAATKYILIEVLLDVVYFPVWWYTKGVVKLGRYCIASLAMRARNLSLGIWLKNMFTPMFGQYDWQGRLISFMMRVVMLVYKFIAFGVWAIIVTLLFVFWLVVPVAAGWYALYQMVNLPLPFLPS
ncbi:MAG: hypothetical protein UY52_C0018G0012 [Parcubacteria group bacterium GW2011_GWC2_49_9]|nr:MAG: hypothetical protein UY34_C0006G0015 [Parcubacteria group bacterium GW2011_GWA2_48_9]KKW15542.1 MAG: hypothetical protein UY52_C0018G0012 [Parcubacteria group bacterium GW2011_GWC2_49_9]